MQVAMAGRRIAAVLVALSIVAVGWSSIGAQDPEVHRFFGFLGDITIDGEPVGPGSTIAALVDDEVVAETVVNAAGAWILDVETAVFGGGDCNLTFVVNDLRAETAWETCTMRVRLALTSPEGATTTSVSESDAPASTAADQSDDSATEPAADAEPDAAEDELEEEIAEARKTTTARLSPRNSCGPGRPSPEAAASWKRSEARTGLVPRQSPPL